MRIQLRGAPATPEQQEKNNANNNYWVVSGVLTVLLVYAYLFSNAPVYFDIPSPQDVLGKFDIQIKNLFKNVRDLGCSLHIQHTSLFGAKDERLVLFAVILLAFLSGYFLPIKYKKAAFVLWFLLGFGFLYGLATTLIFLAAHLTIYLSLHYQNKNIFAVRETLSLVIFGVLYLSLDLQMGMLLLVSIGVAGLSLLILQFVLDPIVRKKNKWVGLFQTLIIQTPILFAALGAISEGLTQYEWTVPVGIIFLFWQWERLIIYYVDFRGNGIPDDISVIEYLSIFMSPATISNNRYAPYVGQGYSYLAGCFYSLDKNRIIINGVKLISIALFYFLFNQWFLKGVRLFIHSQFGITVYEYSYQVVRQYVAGESISTATVLITTFLDQVRVFLISGAVTHFRVGTWRLLGYNMDPQYNKPWKATNLVSLWSRFAFHYREFLVRAFYYPVFFRFFKKRPYLRTFTATMIATAIGNLLWGHIPDHLYYRGVTWDYLILLLRGWPYYILLGLGISLTQLYLMKRKRKRRPWTWDRYFARDILFSFLTFQFFSLIHIFSRTTVDSTLADHAKLFLIGLGIHL